jgi:hypothetical protein
MKEKEAGNLVPSREKCFSKSLIKRSNYKAFLWTSNLILILKRNSINGNLTHIRKLEEYSLEF